MLRRRLQRSLGSADYKFAHGNERHKQFVDQLKKEMEKRKGSWESYTPSKEVPEEWKSVLQVRRRQGTLHGGGIL